MRCVSLSAVQAGCALLFALEGWRIGEGGVSPGWAVARAALGGDGVGRGGAWTGTRRGGSEERGAQERPAVNSPGGVTCLIPLCG